jgi:hypothetical protein
MQVMPGVGGLDFEDDSLECAAALASPIKGKESRVLTKVSWMLFGFILSITRTIITVDLEQS